VKDEYDDGGTAICVAINDLDGEPLAALNFACLSSRFEGKRAMLLRELFRAKAELTALLKKIAVQ
jgi:DNA-binding IclR family transcriptional regulator